ncbi:ATP-binding protein [Paenarthrobacter sp. NPDC092416]|uniref:ATP-binding protein n=1 Tax=Paenarthrobacter sp. NPDC092416 TaxID=3364386 RepID=UPI0038140A68
MLPEPWLDEDTVTVGLRTAAFTDRRQLLDLILDTVPSPATSGIVVVGDKGSGKSHLLLQIEAGLRGSFDVRTFAGKQELENTLYGALPGASADLPDEALLPGLNVIRALADTLGPETYVYRPAPARRRSKRLPAAARPPLVLLVDDIHYVDPASLAILLQLIPGFGATLVATADSRVPLPQDLYQLWEDGFLEQHFLPPFSFSEAHTLCESVLGGHVQPRASALMAAMSGFNVGLLCIAIEDARQAGLLVQRDGFWTINVRAHCDWPGVVQHVRTENASRTESEQRALELIALAEPLALDVVERSFGQRTVELLLGDNFIRILPGKPPFVRTGSWLRGEGTRLAVPRSRSRALRLSVDEPQFAQRSPAALVRWVAWTLDCEIAVADELLLAVAPAADRPSTAELAMKAAAAVSGSEHLPEAKLLTARALIAEGQLTTAWPILRELAGRGSPAEVKAEASSRLRSLGLLGVVPAEDVQGPGASQEPGEHIVWDIQEAERLLLAGETGAALVFTAEAMAATKLPSLQSFRPGVLLRHVMCLRHSLDWDHLDSLLDCTASYAMPAQLAVCLEVARGYAQISQGLPRAAGRTLEPVVAELSDVGLPPVLGLAAALSAYSAALCGDSDKALSRMAQSRSAMSETRGGAGSADLLFHVSSVFVAAALDRAERGSAHLRDVAEQARLDGFPMVEAEALSLLTLNGSGTGVDDDLAVQRRLGELASSLHGAGGAALGTFAEALLGNDPRALEAAGRELSGARLFAHAAICYSKASEIYQVRARGAASRRAATLLGRLRSAFDNEVAPPLGWLPGTAGR